MERSRRYVRVSLLVDIVIQAGERSAMRFAGRVFNISRGGMAVFSRQYVPPGVPLTVELTVPLEGEGLRCVTLCGVTRWSRLETDGAVLGVELAADAKVGDYAWYTEHFELCVGACGHQGRQARREKARLVAGSDL
jgi:hypothetical protein